ncbi:hypothetical protein BV339_00274 [Pseudomonas syringae pv. actinidiae]|nr:hypothetical protein BV339_00274 [Pseudomonas syringae pv. actinidiae]
MIEDGAERSVLISCHERKVMGFLGEINTR